LVFTASYLPASPETLVVGTNLKNLGEIFTIAKIQYLPTFKTHGQ